MLLDVAPDGCLSACQIKHPLPPVTKIKTGSACYLFQTSHLYTFNPLSKQAPAAPTALSRTPPGTRLPFIFSVHKRVQHYNNCYNITTTSSEVGEAGNCEEQHRGPGQGGKGEDNWTIGFRQHELGHQGVTPWVASHALLVVIIVIINVTP